MPKFKIYLLLKRYLHGQIIVHGTQQQKNTMNVREGIKVRRNRSGKLFINISNILEIM